MAALRGVVVAAVVLCLQAPLIQAQTSVPISVDGVYYVAVEAGDNIDWADAQAACEDLGYTLAVFESKNQYLDFMYEFLDGASGADSDGTYYLGLKKSDRDPYVRTAIGKRPTPFSNFFDVYEELTGVDKCVFMDFVKFYENGGPPHNEFTHSPWYLQDCTDTSTGYVCMDAIDYECHDDEDKCPGYPGFQRGDEKVCFWNPAPERVFTWWQAYKMCAKGNGYLLNLYDDEDKDTIEYYDLVDSSQSWNRYWLGLLQKPGEGVPRWSNGYIADENWDTSVVYGSALNSVPYAGMYRPRDGVFTMHMTAPFSVYKYVADVDHGDRVNREAFVICEARQADFCLANTPDLKNADKDSPCCEKVVYTCKPGFILPDGEISQTFYCSCYADQLKYLDVQECIVRNPCWDDPILCGNYSHCVFTAQVAKPYYCMCNQGYRKNYIGECEDIDECAEGYPCEQYYAYCINYVGSYSCHCSRGYGWDHHGKCSVLQTYGTSEITVYFSMRMAYDPYMADPHSPISRAFRGSLEEMVSEIYTGSVAVNSFSIKDGTYDILDISLVLTLYTEADLAELSVLVYKFYYYLQASHSFYINSNHYSYITDLHVDIPHNHYMAIDSLCSVYHATNACNGSPCKGNSHDYTPVCECKAGYTGLYCEMPIHRVNPTAPPAPPAPSTHHTYPPLPTVIYPTKTHWSQKQVIGLAVGLGLLVLLIVIIITIVCCAALCRGHRVPKADHQVYAAPLPRRKLYFRPRFFQQRC